MEDPLLSLGLLLVVAKVAKVAEGIFGRVNQSSIVAYVATGVLLGPVLGVVEPTVDLALLPPDERQALGQIRDGVLRTSQQSPDGHR